MKKLTAPAAAAGGSIESIPLGKHLSLRSIRAFDDAGNRDARISVAVACPALPCARAPDRPRTGALPPAPSGIELRLRRSQVPLAGAVNLNLLGIRLLAASGVMIISSLR